MNVAEASRQYQAALEAERRLRAELDGVLSAEDLLGQAAEEVEHARRALERAWMAQELDRVLARAA